MESSTDDERSSLAESDGEDSGGDDDGSEQEGVDFDSVEHRPHRLHQVAAPSYAPASPPRQGDLLGSWVQGWGWCPGLLQQLSR